MYFFFFFQAEDGIRDKLVTGVQTCALPISVVRCHDSSCRSAGQLTTDHGDRKSVVKGKSVDLGGRRIIKKKKKKRIKRKEKEKKNKNKRKKIIKKKKKI